ncbi:hypothetical protein [Flavobacterium sp. H122]|uniref:hypothetical protein n=1 Tax=Flavobacterium sp. H122 TaxID=2529860 RepID=UPI0010AA3690|nr:hypothetical protein [Flavobacterium sp. H122]
MKNFIIYLGILILTSTVELFSQETFEGKAKGIAYRIEKITKEEKGLLKLQVEEINNELEKGIINRDQADEKKLKLAEATASRIESRVAEEEAKLTELVKEKVEGRIAYLDTTLPKGRMYGKGIKVRIGGVGDTTKVSEKRTTSQLVFAAGVNNLVTGKSVAHSDFRYWGSHFYELGWTYNSRILKENNLLHFKYGLSVQYNNLRPTDNRYFVENGKQTVLQTASQNLDDSRLRNVNLVMPLYLEFDFSKKQRHKGKPFYQTHKSFRLGLGGFIGANVKTKQILKYEQNGHDMTLKEKGSFNVNDFVYGLGAYLGYKETSLYVKYDLNPLFKDNPVDQNNISLGVRFDFN